MNLEASNMDIIAILHHAYKSRYGNDAMSNSFYEKCDIDAISTKINIFSTLWCFVILYGSFGVIGIYKVLQNCHMSQHVRIISREE